MAQTMFRKVSLEKLSSPEQLDQTLKITSPRGWVILAGLWVIILGAIIWSIISTIPTTATAEGIIVRKDGLNPIVVYTAGTIETMLIKPGQYIYAGTPIAYIRTPQGTVSLATSTLDGLVTELWAMDGSLVTPGTSIAVTEFSQKPMIAVMYVNVQRAKEIMPGMEVYMTLADVPANKYGVLVGNVRNVSSYPASTQGLKALFNSDLLISLFEKEAPAVEVTVTLKQDEMTQSHFKWTTVSGPPMQITSGTFFSAITILKKQHPIEMVLPIKVGTSTKIVRSL